MKNFTIVLAFLISNFAWGRSPNQVYVMPGSGTLPGWGQVDLSQSAAVKNQTQPANGGTGVATIPAHATVIGEGTSPVAVASPGAAGQIYTSNGPTSDPSFQPNSGAQSGLLQSFIGFTCPSGYLAANGGTASRTTYPTLFNASTIQTTATTSPTTTLSAIPSTALMQPGMAITGGSIPSGTVISSITDANDIVISNAATLSATGVSIIVYEYGAGDGTTTFGLPNAQGVAVFGVGSQTIAGVNGTKTYTEIQGTTSGDTTAVNSIHDAGHSHGFNGFNTNGFGESGVPGIETNIAASSSGTFSIATGYASITGNDAVTAPAHINALYCVKY